MKQITVYQVEDDWIEEAKRQARARGISMNSIFVEALAKAFGTQRRTNGLERYACDSEFGEGWDEHLAELRQVDPRDLE